MPKKPMCDSEHHEIDIRKISNGYVTRKTRSAGGEYESSEEFSKEKPQLNAGLTQHDDKKAGGEALRMAISHIRGTK